MLCPYQLARCGCHEGIGHSKQLGECDLARCSNRSQASLSHLGLVERSHGVVLWAGHRSRGGKKATLSIKTDWPSHWLCPKIPRVAISTSWNDGRRSILCFHLWTIVAPIGACWGPRAGRCGGSHCHGPVSRGILWWRCGQGRWEWKSIQEV